MNFLFQTRLAFAVFSIVLISCGTTYPVSNSGNTTTTSTKTNTPYNAGELQKDILHYVNQYRSSIGRKPLTFIDPANVQATVHSANMATGKTRFSHDGFDQRITTISKEIGGGVNFAAEN